MSTTTDILTQLEELWEIAEPGPFKADDTVICRHEEGGYAVRLRAGYDNEGVERVRVLERAKPKPPEWEAVVASCVHDEERKREVYHLVAGEMWESNTRYLSRDELVDPVPLVEMPEREEILAALEEGWDAWMRDERALGGADGHRADAVLELLERR